MVTKNRVGFDRNHFALPHPFYMFLTSALDLFMAVTVLAPDSVPAQLGVVRTSVVYMANNYPVFMYYMAVLTLVIHLLESLYAVKLCSDADMTVSAKIKWFLSTMIFGFSSVLYRLKPYVQRAKRSQF
ncbi:transmembrane protein 254 [Plakobranchus ocellatus]|uniref:Transmembrane protein 254 n=1 Tax=Plakobranchus ocellatus TaxID=259542 RepID=A0AAV4ACS8_9GAST|nr:transmembrane protein 254 [Plakobranchus ocellatus]